MKKITLLISLILANITLCLAQNLIIKHDLITKNTEFYRVGRNNKLKKVKRPYIKQNEVVKIEVTNYNKNYWTVDLKKAEVASETQESSSSFDAFTSFFSVYGKFISTVSAVSKGEKSMDTENSVNCDQNTILLNTVYAKLFELKYNSKLPADSIKALATGVYQQFLSSVSTDSYKLPALNIAEPSTIKPEQMVALSKSMMNSCQFNQMYASKGVTVSKAKSDPLLTVYKMYNEIVNTDYTYQYSMLAGSKDLRLNLNFKRSPLMIENIEKLNATGEDETSEMEEIDSATATQVVSSEIFSIPVMEGIQIGNSMGLSFSYIGSQRKEYFFQNDSILSEGKDIRIVPLVNSMLNFYKRSNSSLKFGGSVGIGVAVQEKLQMHYMFGLSCVLGQSERIVLSTGLILSPVERLTKGYRVGEVYLNKEIDDVDLKTVYLPGYYFSISFALSGKKSTTTGGSND
jgi:hypothetical protein